MLAFCDSPRNAAAPSKSMLPFSDGPRNCVGLNFANANIRTHSFSDTPKSRYRELAGCLNGLLCQLTGKTDTSAVLDVEASLHHITSLVQTKTAAITLPI
eukprot:1158227-Pelagomonas_calceolata.AAC.4